MFPLKGKISKRCVAIKHPIDTFGVSHETVRDNRIELFWKKRP
jgi:hypothetical protein